MIKIVFIVESLETGGTELSLLKWLRHCDRKVFEPSVISFRKGDLGKDVEALGIPVRIIHKKIPFDVLFLCRLAGELKKIRPDVVHCRNGIPAVSYGVAAARIAGIPAVSSVHGRTHYIRRNFKIWLWFRIMRWSRTVVAVTEGIKGELSRQGGIKRDKIKVIYNGIDTTDQAVLPSKEDLRREFGLSPDDFLIGSVGNLRPIKGQKYLIQAMPEILRRVANAQLALIGRGEEEQNLRNLVRELGLDDKIRFLGYQKDAGRLTGMFNVFVLPSLSEGFPNVLLEAMRAQVPIVATRVGGVEEVVPDGQEAILVTPSDSRTLAQAVIQLAENPALRETLSANALRRVKDRFDIRETLAQYDAAYLSLTKTTSP